MAADPSTQDWDPREPAQQPPQAARGEVEVNKNSGQHHRVVSVSPHAHDCGRDSIDAAIAELAEALEAARSAGRALHALAAQHETSRERATAASNQLQDRLLLGARMLKAFQTQVDRIEAALTHIGEREARVAEAERLMRALAEREAGRFNEIIERASEEKLAQFRQRLELSNAPSTALPMQAATPVGDWRIKLAHEMNWLQTTMAQVQQRLDSIASFSEEPKRATPAIEVLKGSRTPHEQTHSEPSLRLQSWGH